MSETLKTFTNAIGDIQTQIFEMALIVEKEIRLAVEALVSSEKHEIKEVIDLDKDVDQYDNKIHSSILQLITIQPPLPKELEKLTAMIRISCEYERIGDNAVNIADLSEYTTIDVQSDVFQRIDEMSKLTSTMLEASIDVLKTKDQEQAPLIVESDDDIDQYFSDNQQYIIQEMSEEKKDMESLANLLLVNRYLERSGDHIVNVMRQVESGNY